MLDPKVRIKILTTTLNRHRDLYYNKNAPEITDAEYDALFDQLKKLEEECGYTLPESPTRTVGYKPDEHLTKTTHTIPLLSLDKTKDVKDIARILGWETLLFMPKLDGLTVKLTYEHGYLVEAATRGDGMTGEIVTGNARTFLNVPKHIPIDQRIVVAGEAFVTYPDFEKQKAEGRWSTPRNYAAGSVRSADPAVCATRNITFSAFSPLEGFGRCDTLEEAFQYMETLGIPHVPYLRYEKDGWKDTEWYHMAIEEMKNAAEEKCWPIDGVVARYNDLALGAKKGATAHHYKYALAYKFADEVELTTLKDIEWTVGRTGVLTPVAVVEPVELDGTTIERASLHNLGQIRKLKLGIGDSVEIAKANMIIPQITKNLTKSNTYQMITHCPECGKILTRDETEKDPMTVCLNPSCPGRVLGKFMRLTGKDGLDIQGLSEKTLTTLIKRGYLRNLPDIFGLHKYRNELITFCGLGTKRCEDILQKVENSRYCTLDRYIMILGIPGIGKTAAKTIDADCHGEYTTFMSKITQRYNWAELSGIGEAASDSIYAYFLDNANMAEAKDFATNLLFNCKYKNVGQSTENPGKNVGEVTYFTGKRVSVSGRFDVPKKQIEAELEAAGAKVQDRVSAATNYLICDLNAETTDVRTARRKNIQILSYAEMQDKLKGENI